MTAVLAKAVFYSLFAHSFIVFPLFSSMVFIVFFRDKEMMVEVIPAAGSVVEYGTITDGAKAECFVESSHLCCGWHYFLRHPRTSISAIMYKSMRLIILCSFCAYSIHIFTSVGDMVCCRLQYGV